MVRDHRPDAVRLAAALVIAAALVVGPAGGAALAEDYHRALGRVLTEHKRVAAAKAEVEGAEDAASRARSAWFPNLSVTGAGGQQRINTSDGKPATRAGTRDLSVGVRQPIWDFGAINAGIDKADIGVRQSTATLEMVGQDLLLEGLIAYINLERARRSMAFAQQSVANIAKQTGLEESKVELGGGVTSDVLQAKSQLAGAQARLARAKGQTANAVNRFRAVFGHEPDGVDGGQHIPVPFDLMPASLEDALESARKRNLQLEVSRLTTEGGRAEIDRVRAVELAPRLQGVAQRKWERNPDGLMADRLQHVVKVEMTYQLNGGLGAYYAIDAAQQALLAAENRYAERRDLIEEQVRDAWRNLDSARENARYLDNQVHIVGEFLRLAREERVQGKRSLIDVLSGETSLINAQSDAASADADVAIAAYTLFRATGLLDLGTVP